MATRPLVTRYADDLGLFPDMWHKVGLVVGVAVVLAFPFAASSGWLSTGNTALVYVVGATGLMVLTGYCGQISLGHAAFLAIGAYTTAIAGELFHAPFWLSLFASGLVAAAVGLAVGPFALRLRGLYLAIVTIGLLYLVNHTLLSFTELTHGVAGIAVPRHSWFSDDGSAGSLGAFAQELDLGFVTLEAEQKLYFVFVAIATVAVWLAKNVQRTHTGRAMMAVRDHDIAAAVLGVNPASTKIVSFGLSSFLAGVAGSMFALQQQYITVSPPFDLNMSVHYIAIIVLGGMGTVFGAVYGAVVFAFLEPLTHLVGDEVPLFNQLSEGQQSALLFSLVVAAFLIFEPLGLFGIWLRIKRYFVTWPFRY